MCDYCPRPAVYLAFVETETSGMTRLACRGHHDRARNDCSAIHKHITITEINQEDQ